MLSLIDPQDLFMCSDGISFLMRAKAETKTCLSDMKPHVSMYLFTRINIYICVCICNVGRSLGVKLPTYGQMQQR